MDSHVTGLLLLLLAGILPNRCPASQLPLSCQSCVFYANIAMPINNPACASGRDVGSEPCAAGHACKVTFLQDSGSAIVHAARSCQRPISSRPLAPAAATAAEAAAADAAYVIFNARTTMYCDSSGCNNNWLGRAAPGGEAGPRRLHCWVGHGRRIDEFQLQPCSDRVMQLASAGNASGGGGQQTPVCLLAQLTRQILYKGRAFESAMYLADCAPHASSVYGRNYPMFEYERVCRTAGCNSGAAAAKLQDGLIAETVAGNSATTSAAVALGAVHVVAVACLATAVTMS